MTNNWNSKMWLLCICYWFCFSYSASLSSWLLLSLPCYPYTSLTKLDKKCRYPDLWSSLCSKHQQHTLHCLDHYRKITRKNKRLKWSIAMKYCNKILQCKNAPYCYKLHSACKLGMPQERCSPSRAAAKRTLHTLWRVTLSVKCSLDWRAWLSW